MMIPHLRATLTVDSVHEIDFAMLREMGIVACLFDLDETLCPRKTVHLVQPALDFLLSPHVRSFKIGILSNRRGNADDPIIDALAQHVPVVTRAWKPGRRGFRAILSILQTTPSETAMIGDKWITDILGASRMKLGAAIRVRRSLSIEVAPRPSL